ncbi:DUF167 domain-containing protein [Ectothiorhodospiraceae bacterium 2226]|nr:DUF167 domain-containing protein [Ectothiorhodospiraceae bacterium 2226]
MPRAPEAPAAAPPFVRPGAAGVELHLKVVPGASRTELAGALGAHLKVRVAAPPEGGKANRAVLALLAERLGTKALELVAGHSHPEKVVRVCGCAALSAAQLARLSERRARRSA